MHLWPFSFIANIFFTTAVCVGNGYRSRRTRSRCMYKLYSSVVLAALPLRLFCLIRQQKTNVAFRAKQRSQGIACTHHSPQSLKGCGRSWRSVYIKRKNPDNIYCHSQGQPSKHSTLATRCCERLPFRPSGRPWVSYACIAVPHALGLFCYQLHRKLPPPTVVPEPFGYT